MRSRNAGSLIVSSDRDVAAVAYTGYTGGSATDDNKTGSAYSGFSEGSTTINIPSLFQRPNAQFSRITVQNMGTGVANVSLNYYSRDGTAFAGNPITVTVTSPSLQGERSAVTDSTGRYLIRGLPAGRYTVRVELPGMTASLPRE